MGWLALGTGLLVGLTSTRQFGVAACILANPTAKTTFLLPWATPQIASTAVLSFATTLQMAASFRLQFLTWLIAWFVALSYCFRKMRQSEESRFANMVRTRAGLGRSEGAIEGTRQGTM